MPRLIHPIESVAIMSSSSESASERKEFNLVSMEFSMYVGGWQGPPRFKPCLANTSRHVSASMDGIGSVEYGRILEEAETKAQTQKGGACFVGMIRCLATPKDKIPKSVKERVEARIVKGEKDDQEAVKKTSARRTRTPAAAGKRTLSRPNRTFVDGDKEEASAPPRPLGKRSTGDMPPPSAPSTKRMTKEQLAAVELRELRPAALEQCDARLVEVPEPEPRIEAEEEVVAEEQQQRHFDVPPSPSLERASSVLAAFGIPSVASALQAYNNVTPGTAELIRSMQAGEEPRRREDFASIIASFSPAVSVTNTSSSFVAPSTGSQPFASMPPSVPPPSRALTGSPLRNLHSMNRPQSSLRMPTIGTDTLAFFDKIVSEHLTDSGADGQGASAISMAL